MDKDIFSLPPLYKLDALIHQLEGSFPDKHPRGPISEYEQGYRAGAIEIIRRLKEVSRG